MFPHTLKILTKIIEIKIVSIFLAIIFMMGNLLNKLAIIFEQLL